MTIKHHAGLAAAILSVGGMAIVPAVHAQTITNGGFNTDASGWTATHIDGAGGHRISGGNPGGFFILNDAGSTLTDPTLSQTLTGLVVGGIYTITGDFKPVHINTGFATGFGVSIDGTIGYEGVNKSFTVWKPFSFSFTAAATSTTLSLSAERNGSDDDYGVDNLALAPAAAPAVPEASSVVSLGLLLLLGLGGVVVSRRRRAGAAR